MGAQSLVRNHFNLRNMESVDTVSLSFSIDNDGVIQDIPPVTISKELCSIGDNCGSGLGYFGSISGF